MKTCLHCHTAQPTASRGLCRRCYEMPGVKYLYPTLHGDRQRQGHGLDLDAGKMPSGRLLKYLFRPTDALPGTEIKLEVMEVRASLGLPLFHPQDARANGQTFTRTGGFLGYMAVGGGRNHKGCEEHGR